MKEKIREFTQSKAFHISVIILIIAILLFILGIVILRYNVEGEKNMPFTLSKIAIISSSEGIDQENVEHEWDFKIDQNNDIYLYIEKNNNYTKTEIIDSVVLNNFSFEKQSEFGEIGLYKPDSLSEKQIFKTSDENKLDQIEYKGDVNSDIKNLKMSNQGDMISFRISNRNIKEYVSDEEEIIEHNNLLKKLDLTNDDLKIKATFDITINLKSGKAFNTKVALDLPVEDVIDKGTTFTEITDTSKFIFKRVKN